MSADALSALDLDSIEHWRAMCPGLHIEGDLPLPSFDVGDVDELVGQLKFEGYINTPGVLPKSVFKPLRDAVATLHAAGIPLAFAFVYDEFWHAFQGVSRFVQAALGDDYRALPDFWVWHVLPTEGAAGFGPHRDRVQKTLDPDNSPHTLTVWLPFSDATPLNGCMYVLPAHHDERFSIREWGGEGNNVVKQPQNIRALPATAGSLLAWNQALLHWGARASRLGEAPRTSAGFEFQRADKAPFNQPLLDPMTIPTFSQRLGLIGKQVLQYQHMYPLAPDVERLAVDLRDRFMPELSPQQDFSPAPSQVFTAAPPPVLTPVSSIGFDPDDARPALNRRFQRRTVVDGEITLPAAPSMIEEYVKTCDKLFSGVGRRFTAEELAHLRSILEDQLARAYKASPRSTITIKYNAPAGSSLSYTITPKWKSINETYHDWIATREPPLFGKEPDARIWAVAQSAANPTKFPVLDIGAGTGRNALPLARRGHPVDVVEMTPKFAEIIRTEVAREGLRVRVIERDVFATTSDLRQDYQMILLSEVVPEFRTTRELRSLFELANQCLAPGGRLVFNAFLSNPGYELTASARELGEQMYTSIFTQQEMFTAAAGLPLKLTSDDSVYEYEKANLPDGAWPPTGWYGNWVSGMDVFDVPREQSPIEMRWLVYQKWG